MNKELLEHALVEVQDVCEMVETPLDALTYTMHNALFLLANVVERTARQEILLDELSTVFTKLPTGDTILYIRKLMQEIKKTLEE